MFESSKQGTVFSTFSFYLRRDSGNTFEQQLKKEYIRYGSSITGLENNISAVINATLFAQHHSDDILTLLPDPHKASAKKLKRDGSKFWNVSRRPVLVLNQNLHANNRIYTAGEVKVKSHWRWQPYGPRTDTKYKLISISEHRKVYKNV